MQNLGKVYQYKCDSYHAEIDLKGVPELSIQALGYCYFKLKTDSIHYNHGPDTYGFPAD